MNLHKKIKQNQGFTLIELMLAIGLLSILMLLAMPNLSQFVQKQKLATQGEIISSTFGVARSEALSRLSNVHVCWNPKSETSDKAFNGYDISPGKMAVIFLVSVGTPEVIREIDYDIENTLTVDDETDNCVNYSAQGRLMSMEGNSLIFGVCRAANNNKDSRSIEINSTGRATVKKNVNGNTQKIACT